MRYRIILLGAIAFLAAVHADANVTDEDADDEDADDDADLFESDDGQSTDPDASGPGSDFIDPFDPKANIVPVHSIDADNVQPFPESKPCNDSQTTALKYKPRLLITDGCHPYPAVQSDGAVSAGFEWSRFNRHPCEGSPLGSQVYARSSWYEDKWAVMYVWYFPMALDSVSTFVRGHRHYWLWAIVWTSGPDPDESTFLGVSMSGDHGITKQLRPKSKYVFNETTVLLKSHEGFFSTRQGLELTKKSGGTQNLVTWDQLTPEARTSLSSLFRTEVTANPPLQDRQYFDILKKAYLW
ncbi:putative necrosis inducing protein [Plasmopara halstedii]